jgi:pimeloyl-ACP methyl ester carboxylesterase
VEHKVTAADGRVLAVKEGGDPDGAAVLAFWGTPNSRHIPASAGASAGAHGIRLISYDRPGYGGSDPQPGRTVASCVNDVRAICAALGISRFAAWGGSGGGPHALACAALLPDMVAAVAPIASLAPFGAAGLDWFAGMGQHNVDSNTLAVTDPAGILERAEKEREMLLAAGPEDLLAAMATLLSPADAAVLTGELAEQMKLAFDDGLAPGAEGWAEDTAASVAPWGFSVAAVTVPVLVLHGREDRFSPFGHGEWLAAHVPGAEAWLFDHDGHLTLFENRMDDVHAWLLSHLQRDRPRGAVSWPMDPTGF